MRYNLSRRPATDRRATLRVAAFLFAALLTQPSSSSAQELRPRLDDERSRWITIERVELGAVDLDTSRVVVISPGVYQVRTRWRFASVQTSPEGYHYQTSVAVRGIDCRRRQIALIAFADHDGRKIVRTEAQPAYAARWDRVNPESIIDRLTTRVCERGQRQGTITASAGG